MSILFAFLFALCSKVGLKPAGDSFDKLKIQHKDKDEHQTERYPIASSFPDPQIAIAANHSFEISSEAIARAKRIENSVAIPWTGVESEFVRERARNNYNHNQHQQSRKQVRKNKKYVGWMELARLSLQEREVDLEQVEDVFILAEGKM